MSTGHVLLGLLSAGDRHGYDLKHEHDERFPAARPLAFGQLYAALDRLKKRGSIVPVEVEQVDGPERTVFGLTDQGRAELAEWMATVEEPSPYVANPLATKATIALLVADESAATDFLTRQRQAHLDRMRHYTRRKTDPRSSIAEVLGADYAIAHLDADLRWLDTAINRISSLTKEVAR